LAYPVAKRFIAGERLDDAIARARITNARGMAAIINLLGEHTSVRSDIEWAAREYEVILRRVETEGIRGCISIKPSQVGLALDVEFARDNLRPIVESAKSLGAFVWLDMEESTYTQSTIDLYNWLHAKHTDSGLAIQANLKRTRDDLEQILSHGGIVRLCKGAYGESLDIAWKSKSDIDRSFNDLMEILFAEAKRFAIATHDQKLIENALKMLEQTSAEVEFQMLMGIRDDLKPSLVSKDLPLSEYIPYGRTWFSYSIRRLRERKRNILLLFRALFS
jgi:proline dehydrogenase